MAEITLPPPRPLSLTDVDVVIGGDSHTLLGDFRAQGLPSSGPYPTVAKNRDGDPVCIGHAGCETANTLARGSDAAQVVAEAFLAASPRAEMALQNAGGVRTGIGAGPLSMNTAFTVLPFTNVLVELSLTGAQTVAALEDAVANHLDQRQSDGSHPYAAGLRWALDLRQPKGQRFSTVEVKDRTTGRWTAIDPARTYVPVSEVAHQRVTTAAGAVLP